MVQFDFTLVGVDHAAMSADGSLAALGAEFAAYFASLAGVAVEEVKVTLSAGSVVAEVSILAAEGDSGAAIADSVESGELAVGLIKSSPAARAALSITDAQSVTAAELASLVVAGEGGATTTRNPDEVRGTFSEIDIDLVVLDDGVDGGGGGGGGDQTVVIAGAVAGSLAAVALLAGAAVVARRRQQQARYGSVFEPTAGSSSGSLPMMSTLNPMSEGGEELPVVDSLLMSGVVTRAAAGTVWADNGASAWAAAGAGNWMGEDDWDHDEVSAKI